MLRGLIGKLFGNSTDLKEVIARKPTYVDVRSPQEFSSGHIKGAKNIPLQSLNSNLNKIKKDKPVIVYCKSGTRSAMAKGILKQNGYEVYNGGGYSSLKQKINS